MSNRKIEKVAVLGSGVMGSRIACHFANIGVQALLLDIRPEEPNEREKAKGLDANHPLVRNRIVNESLQAAIKSNPSPLYLKSFADRIETGNFDDDMHRISEADWIIEVVVERLDIKKTIFDQVEAHRKPGTPVTSNTSGIPIAAMSEGRSEDFRKHFCGTHFFNPPRYLPLLEIIPGPDTLPEIVDFLLAYGSKFLGKETVPCKDTPAFIANRVGVFSILDLFHTVEDMGLTVEEVDKLTGPVIGHPKSATFRTADVVGIDTLVHVANGLRENCPDDERNDVFEIPSFVRNLVDSNRLGSKSGAGFYKKVKDDKGGSEILSLDLETGEYGPRKKASFPTLEMTKPVDDLGKRLPMLYKGGDKAGEFYRRTFHALFAYVSHRIPEISDDLFRVDDALRAGFGWKLGPFETWDALGFEEVLKNMEEAGVKAAPWVHDMQKAGFRSFYKLENGVKYAYDVASKDYKALPVEEGRLYLDRIADENVLWKNAGTTIRNLGDGIIHIEFHTKMNTIGAEVIEGLNKAVDMAEAEYKGLVISNDGENFSAGANVGMIFMMAVEQEFDELEFAIKRFQDTMMRLRYSSIPVIAAPHNLALGGGCELAMHADKVIAHAELYMGLVEMGVGVIPGGGGSKEFALRTSDELGDGDIRVNTLRNRFLTIGQAKVSTSAHEAFELGYLRKGIDEVVINRKDQLAYAKQAALMMHAKGYTKPIPRKDILVLGNEGMGIVYVGAHSMMSGHYISEHDKHISEKLGYVLCGGDLSEPTRVSEEYLLSLERRAFLELCATRKTLERLQNMVKYGKVLRN